MNWEVIRKQYPNQWLLIEAIEAHSTEDHERIIDKLALIEPFDNFFDAIDEYKKLRKQSLQREMYVIHADKEQITIKERQWLGIRSMGWK